MSEEIKPTPEEVIQARKDKEAKINARIAELKLCEGKWFVKNDGSGKPTRVNKYAGIHVVNGIATYFLSVEVPGHAAGNPPATDFLDEYHLLDPQPATEQTATNLQR